MSSFDNKFNHLKLLLRDIQNATNNFARENIVQRDKFGNHYKGQLVLRSGQSIDIVARRLDHKRWQGTKEFHTEIMMLDSLKHRNVVSIVGFCNDNGEMIIVNKYEARGSLDQYLSDPVTLTWTQRLQICLDIAHALSYIFYDEQSDFSIIHRNIKSSKILLDDNWEAKLSDFRLCKRQPAAERHLLAVDSVYGTPGYMDPAYESSNIVSYKSDIYSFGVVLFEVLTGRKAFIPDNNGMLLAELAKSHYENTSLGDIIHPILRNQMDEQALKTFSEVAYWCLNKDLTQRPNTDRVIFALEQSLSLQLAHEKSEDSRLADKGISANYWKGKKLEHLRIGLDAIKSATNEFDDKYCIGSGGYGVVYEAKLEHYDSSVMKGNEKSEPPKRVSIVAIKRITNTKDSEGEQGFLAEIETLNSCKHPNVISLLGFCYEPPHMILVYELVPNGSLDNYLGSEGKMTNLTWLQRIKICIDIARGLDYIHTTMDNKQKIIHRDIKSANILLTENWEAKIADFGLSKVHPLNHTKSTINTNNVAGTLEYWDPEYESTGKLKKETDVYSFGVVLFEIMSGTLASDPLYTKENERGLAPIARKRFENGEINKMVDPKLKEESTFRLIKGPNQDSLNTFTEIGYSCLAEKQDKRPTMKVVLEKLEKALKFQENDKDSLRISFENIRSATQNFNNQIGQGAFGKIYKGKIGPTHIAVKRWDGGLHGQGEKEFRTELQVLFEYKHENIIGMVGYYDENNEKILVYEYASNGSLDRLLKDGDNLTWTQRLKISIDVASGLDFLHGNGSIQTPLIHRDIKSSNILLNDDWKAKITDFGLSIITPVNNKFEFVVEDACGTPGYVDPQYARWGFLTRKSDIYSLGVVLFEMMCGRKVLFHGQPSPLTFLIPLVKQYYKEGKIDELVFEGIKDKIVPKSLNTFLKIAYQCLDTETEERPTANEVVLQLKKALEFHEDIEIWEAKLPEDYKEIIQMSKTPKKYANVSNKELYEMFSKGILLQEGKVCLSVGSNGERNEMISATMFSYENSGLHKRRSIKKSRFQGVLRITDISNLKTQIKIKTQFLSPNMVYGAYLMFKFCDSRKLSYQPIYVNLKYRLGSETLHAYFATWEDNEWLMIELCRLLPGKKDVDFEVVLESMSRYYCGNGAIYVEGIHFRDITNAILKVKPDEKLKGVERVLKSNSDSVQQVPVDYEGKTQPEDGEKLIPLSKVNEKKCHTLPAKMVLYESSKAKCFKWKSLVESSTRDASMGRKYFFQNTCEQVSHFEEVAEFLSNQVFEIKCDIETQKLSQDTNYACHLVFKLSEKCHGLQCPVKVQDLLFRKNKECQFIYFRSPRFKHLQGNGRVPKLREDGLMEVIVWKFNSGNKDHVPMSLKLRCYEGNMSGLIVYGIKFQPI